MAPEEQLRWEARAARPVALAAFLSVLLVVLGIALGPALVDARPDDDRELLLSFDAQPLEHLVPSIIQAIAALLLIPILLYLYRATKARRPQIPSPAAVLSVVGPIVYATAIVAAQLNQIDVSRDFADLPRGEQTVKRADEMLGDRSPVLLGLSFGAILSMAFAFLLVSLNAMRAGLLSRFMGTLGIIIGVLYVFSLLGGPLLVQLFWVPAIGLLLLDRWPGGRGPAWEAVEEIPWPSAVDRRMEMEEARAAESGGRAEKRAEKRAEPEPFSANGHGDPEALAGDGDGPDGGGADGHPGSKKRKRKRRR